MRSIAACRLESVSELASSSRRHRGVETVSNANSAEMLHQTLHENGDVGKVYAQGKGALPTLSDAVTLFRMSDDAAVAPLLHSTASSINSHKKLLPPEYVA